MGRFRHIWVVIFVVGALAVGFFTNGLDVKASDVSTSKIHPSSSIGELQPQAYIPFMANYYRPGPHAFGIQFYGDRSLWDSRLDLAVEAGANWVRWPISWANVEPTNTEPESYDWTMLDTTVISVTAQGVNLILTLGGQPSWAAVYEMGPVTDVVELEQFMGAMVERYDGDGVADAPGSPVVRHFEIYNEPDNVDLQCAEQGGYGYWGHHGAEYAVLLQRLYPVIKTASPEAQVVFGGLALDWFEENGGIFDSEFMDDALAACQGHDCFDIMNFHYYPPFRYYWESYGPGILGKTNYVRDRLATYGFEGAPVVCTEISWAGEGTEWGSDELQSRFAVKGYVRGLAADLDIIVWFFIQDGDVDSLKPGLVTNDLQRKPVFYAYQTMTEMLRHLDYRYTLTAAQTGSAQLFGYVFEGRHRVDVVWTEDSTPYIAEDDPVLPYTVRAETLRVLEVGETINEEIVSDLDGDGYITVDVGGRPLLLTYNP